MVLTFCTLDFRMAHGSGQPCDLPTLRQLTGTIETAHLAAQIIVYPISNVLLIESCFHTIICLIFSFDIDIDSVYS